MDRWSLRGPAGGVAGRDEGALRHQLYVYWLLVWLYRHGGHDDPARAVAAARALILEAHPVIAGRYRRFLREHDRVASVARRGHPP